MVAAIVTTALKGDYWKPVQAGGGDGTDTTWVRSVIPDFSNTHPEVYQLKLAVSPHIAAREEGISIDCKKIASLLPPIDGKLIIEGAGGLLVPLNESEFVIDLVKHLHARVILVSRNYLGSINHSLLTARICREEGLDVAGWIFNDQYLDYEDEIVQWTGYPKLASIPFAPRIDRNFISFQASTWKERLSTYLC